jgi:hypothetical protein
LKEKKIENKWNMQNIEIRIEIKRERESEKHFKEYIKDTKLNERLLFSLL